MRATKYVLIVISMMLLLSETALAAGSLVDNLDVRPEMGYGYAATKDGKHGTGYHTGVRILSAVRSISSPEPDKRWGIEITALSPFASNSSLKSDKYIAVGLVLEQLLPAQTVATIGTVGYVGVDQTRNNPFGLVTGFAWEPRIGKNMLFTVGLRYESIFDTSTISRYSLNTALKFNMF
jgi:hypothetical protein